MTLLCWIIDFCASFIEVFLFFLLLESCFEKHKYAIETIVSLGAAGTVILLNHIALFSYLNLFYLFLVISIAGCIIVKKELFAVISMASFYVLCLVCYDFFYVSILTTIPYFGADTLSAVLQVGWFRVFFIATCNLGKVALFLLARFWIRRINRERFRTLKMLLISIGGYAGFVYMVNQTFTAYTDTISKLWIAVFSALILLFFILLFEIDLRGKRIQMEREQLNITLLEEKYRSLNEMYSRNARLYHDLNNHLTSLYHLLDNDSVDAARNYIADISRPIQELKRVSWTGNDIVDAVLNSKAETMDKAGIAYHINAYFPTDAKIADADMCTILSNLIDNAIEAVQNLPSQNENISIRMKNINKILFIRVSNPSEPVKIEKDGMPRTSKRTGIHGWGLRNVEHAAENYNGTLQCNYKDGIFESVVTLFYS